jgi:hypothetical protein
MPSEGDFLRLICLTAIKLSWVRGGGIRYHPTPLVGVPHTPWFYALNCDPLISYANSGYTNSGLSYLFPPPNAPNKLPLTDNSFPFVV